jgi:ATP-dependent exoDNAse (exonuclease V) alpha subunit
LATVSLLDSVHSDRGVPPFDRGDARGIGFKTADAISMKLGIEKTAMVRVRAGISYALTEAMDEGHCGLPTRPPGIGYIVDVDADEGELTASFDGRSVTYGFGELDTLVPAYAATIHKSQGSEYPAVVIPVLTQHYAMLQRNLLYTGITRGKRLVVLVGQKKAVAIAVRNVSGRRRWSKLREWLTGAQNFCRKPDA